MMITIHTSSQRSQSTMTGNYEIFRKLLSLWGFPSNTEPSHRKHPEDNLLALQQFSTSVFFGSIINDFPIVHVFCKECPLPAQRSPTCMVTTNAKTSVFAENLP